MKRITVLLIALMMVVAVLAGCSEKDSETGSNSTSSNSKEDKKNEQVTLKVFQFKVQIAEAMNRMAEEYEKETGVKVEVETVGGEVDYETALKAKIASGVEPDIFNNYGNNSLDAYLDRAVDLTDQPWVDRVADFAKLPTQRDGKLYGMPMALEGHGLIYNKDLFAKAGITKPPVTLTELKDTFKKLKDAGIQPISNGFAVKWILTQYMMNAQALHDDPMQFSRDVTSGKLTIASDPFFQKWMEFFDLVLEYSNPNPLTTDYNTQVTMFASGEVAMMGQGNWTQVQIDSINPDLDLGLIAIPVGDAPSESGVITSGVPNNWVVNSKGAHPEEAKAFLDWMVSSDTGKRYIIKEFKFIPALDGIEYEEGDLGDIAEAVLDFVRDDKASSWDDEFPETYGDEWASSMQQYIAGRINAKEFLQQLDEAIQKLAK